MTSPSDPWGSAPEDPWTVPDPSPVPPTHPAHTPLPPSPAPPVSGYPGSGPGSGHPLAEPISGAAPGPVIVQIAEIAVTSTTVHTPAGDIPLAGSQWQVSDYWFNSQRIPKWAIVMAIVGFCVLTVFSLLFLLVKETVTQGTIQITVTNGTRQYVARIPVTDQAQVTTINQQVNYVRSLAAI
ncbi:hypothetical protein GCM10010172_09230 [Paractinoplanes ferrugineus]|uniref:Uncharacterized protein n=1 Tax=Paractinoplanes ferrugineus TaxID=113564 RepID=A0A919IWL7_9ACTN|nr:hypothetical protein [Actinoplanes ferrugineus]GIE09488.1 hypothetical protein Afe05nite_13280 [Actinoplanes ferrugineus]